jgi:tetratricopeptide (TPR) repeat protein
LLGELSTDQHTGPTENAFKEYLQTEAAENLDRALATKGKHLKPDLFAIRGVLLLDKGNMQSAKKEFLMELDEVSQAPALRRDSSRKGLEFRQRTLIACYYNLAVAEDGLGNSKEALSWIRLAEQEQNQYGRTVVPGLSDVRQKLESTITTHDHE